MRDVGDGARLKELLKRALRFSWALQNCGVLYHVTRIILCSVKQ